MPSTEELTVGNARKPSTAARTKKGMKVSFVPLDCSNLSLSFERTAAIPETLTSSTEYTCGETRFESTMCSAMRWRITDMGWTSYWPKYIFSRGTAVSRTADAAVPPAAGGGTEAARAGAAPAAETPDELRDAPPPSMAARISCLLMRPPAPVPGICDRSTLFSRAMRRTSGELRIF